MGVPYISFKNYQGCRQKLLNNEGLMLITIQVTANANFTIRLPYFFYFWQDSSGDRKDFNVYMEQVNFATHCGTTTCGIFSEHFNAKKLYDQECL